MKTAKVCLVLLFVSLALNFWQIQLYRKQHIRTVEVQVPNETFYNIPSNVVIQSGAGVVFHNEYDDTTMHGTSTCTTFPVQRWENGK